MTMLAQTDLSMLFAIVAIGLISAILLRRSYAYLNRQKRDDSALVTPPKPKTAPRARLMDGPVELSRWEVEMYEVARDLSAELTTRASALQATIAEADRAAARLDAALRKAVESGLIAAAPRHSDFKAEPAAKCTPDTAQAVYVLADYGFPVNDIASRIGQPADEIERILRERG